MDFAGALLILWLVICKPSIVQNHVYKINF